MAKSSPSGGDKTFPLGQLVATANAVAQLPNDEIIKALARHSRGDWGDVSKEDHRANEEALRDGTRLFSVYKTSGGQKFWIITEADRSLTTVLLPGDY